MEKWNVNELVEDGLGWIIPSNGDKCICPNCKGDAFIKGDKPHKDEWGDECQKVTLDCPHCGSRTHVLERDWVCKGDLISSFCRGY